MANHIRPRWGAELVKGVKAMAVTNWLETYPHSRQIKAHVRRLMHTLYYTARLWEIVKDNPIDLVRQSAIRLKKPRALKPAEFTAFLGEPTEPCRTLVLTVACLGLRISEALGLQWGDIDFEAAGRVVKILFPTST